MEADVVECKEVLCADTSLVIVVGSITLSIAKAVPSRTITTITSHSEADMAGEVVEIKVEVAVDRMGLSMGDLAQAP